MSGNRSFDGRSYQAPTAISIHKNIPILSSYLISKPILYPFSVGAPENIGPGVGPGGTNAAKSRSTATTHVHMATMPQMVGRRGTLTWVTNESPNT